MAASMHQYKGELLLDIYIALFQLEFCSLAKKFHRQPKSVSPDFQYMADLCTCGGNGSLTFVFYSLVPILTTLEH